MKDLELNFKINSLGGNDQNIKCIADGIKQLPNNLNSFTLILQWNNLGDNTENMKYLVEAIKFLPKNLHKLDLDL